MKNQVYNFTFKSNEINCRNCQFSKKYGLLKTSVSREEIKKILKFVQKNKNLRVLDTAFEYDKFLEKKYRLNLNNLKINTKLSFLEEDFKKDKFENKYLNKLKNKLYFNNLENLRQFLFTILMI